MNRPARLSIVFTHDEIALIQSTIADIEIGGPVRGLLAHAAPVTGGRRISGTDDDIDRLLEAVWSEMRGYQRIDEERSGTELDEPIPGSTAARLATIYDTIEQHLS